METCIGNYFIKNEDIINSCDFNLVELPENYCVYDVFRIIDQKPLFFKHHINRFLNSVKSIHKENNLTKEQISTSVKTLIKYNKVELGNIKMVYFIKNRKPEFYVWLNPFNYPSGETKIIGVECKTITAERPDPKVKHANNELRIRLQKFALENNIYDSILVDRYNFVTEGSKTNLFFIKKKILYSSPQHKVLNGISREIVKKICRENNIKIYFIDINKDKIGNFDSAFLSGSSINVLPIKKIDAIEYDVKNPVFQIISNTFELKIKEDLQKFSWKL